MTINPLGWNTADIKDPSKVRPVATTALDQQHRWWMYFSAQERAELVAHLQDTNPIMQLRALKTIESAMRLPEPRLFVRIERMSPCHVHATADYALEYHRQWSHLYTRVERDHVRDGLYGETREAGDTLAAILFRHREQKQEQNTRTATSV